MSDVRRWWRRVLLAVAGWLVAWGFIALRGGSPQPLLLAIAAATAVVVGGVVVDALAGVGEVDWTPAHSAYSRQWGLDPRFSRLSRSFTDGTEPQQVAEQVHDSLCVVVDGLLETRHGIDRHGDPEAARVVLGDEVAAYLQRPPRYRRGHFSELLPLLTAMESL